MKMYRVIKHENQAESLRETAEGFTLNMTLLDVTTTQRRTQATQNLHQPLPHRWP